MKQISSEILLIILGIIWIIFGLGIYAGSVLRPSPVVISWATETEFETAGFNIYRSDTADGEYRQVNAQLLPGRAEAAAGARYSWEDKNAEPGRSYFYQLEDVEYDNTRTRHEPFEHRASGISPLKQTITISSLILGLTLMIYGGYEKKKRSELLANTLQQ